jgi:hypothetical protein
MLVSMCPVAIAGPKFGLGPRTTPFWRRRSAAFALDVLVWSGDDFKPDTVPTLYKAARRSKLL